MNRSMQITIGIILFILIIGTTYKSTLFSSNIKEDEIISTEAEIITDLEFQSEFPIPIENFIKVTSRFGIREGNKIVSTNHKGIDLCGSIGAKVMSVMDGQVTYSGWQSGYGNCVEIKHLDDSGKEFYTFYGHMRDNSLKVEAGQQVYRGQVLGIQGSTGNSTGDHLHFEVRTSGGSNQYAIDPAPFLFKKL